jgi:hypothetical protein
MKFFDTGIMRIIQHKKCLERTLDPQHALNDPAFKRHQMAIVEVGANSIL